MVINGAPEFKYSSHIFLCFERRAAQSELGQNSTHISHLLTHVQIMEAMGEMSESV